VIRGLPSFDTLPCSLWYAPFTLSLYNRLPECNPSHRRKRLKKVLLFLFSLYSCDPSGIQCPVFFVFNFRCCPPCSLRCPLKSHPEKPLLRPRSGSPWLVTLSMDWHFIAFSSFFFPLLTRLLPSWFNTFASFPLQVARSSGSALYLSAPSTLSLFIIFDVRSRFSPPPNFDDNYRGLFLFSAYLPLSEISLFHVNSLFPY